VNEPTDINDNDPTDDENLSSLYERTSTEQPSKLVDETILAKAKSEIKQLSKSSSYYPGWTQSFSVAAVIVLSVTVVLMIDKESPVLLDISEPVSVIEQKIMKQDALEQETKTTDQFKEKKLAKTPARLQEKRQAKTGGFIDNLTSSLAPSSESVAVINEVVTNKTVTAKARRKLEAPAMEADAEAAKLSRPTQAPRAMMGIVADRANEDVIEGLSCQQLSEKACLESAACTLKKNKDSTSYRCLPAKDHCELMFRQSEGTKESCETKQGCEFIPAQCYCPPDLLCECADGEPNQCGSKNPE
jgi:hypothetical protein